MVSGAGYAHPEGTMTQYDPGVIQHFADKLYQKARRIVAVRTVLGVVTGLAVGFILSSRLHITGADIIGAALFGFFGYQSGMERSFSLVLQAQTALCQMMIEANTRAVTAAAVQHPRAEQTKVAA